MPALRLSKAKQPAGAKVNRESGAVTTPEHDPPAQTQCLAPVESSHNAAQNVEDPFAVSVPSMELGLTKSNPLQT